MSRQQTSGEIDLMELLAKAYRVFLKNILLFIIIPLLCIGIALLLTYNAAKKFSSSMMVTTTLLTENEGRFIFEELGKSDSIPGLDRQNGINLVGLKFGIESATGSPEREVYLKITATVKDPALFPFLEGVVVNYLNNTRPVRRARESKELFYKNMIREIDSEIAGMNKIKEQTDTRSMAAYLSPSDLYAKTVELYEKRSDYELKLKDINTVHVVKGFQSLVKDVNLSKSLAVIIGFLAGTMLALFIVFIRYFTGYYKSMDTPA